VGIAGACHLLDDVLSRRASGREESEKRPAKMWQNVTKKLDNRRGQLPKDERARRISDSLSHETLTSGSREARVKNLPKNVRKSRKDLSGGEANKSRESPHVSIAQRRRKARENGGPVSA